MEVLAVLAVFFFFAAPAAAFVALYKVRSLSDEVEKLRAEVRRARRAAERSTGAEDVHDTPVAGPSPAPPPRHTPTELERVKSTTPHSRIRTRAREVLDPGTRPAVIGREPKESSGAPQESVEPPLMAEQAPPAAEQPTPEEEPTPTAEPVAATLDFETLVGSTWLLRLGLGILAIALALFARSIAPQLSPGAKVALAYGASIAFFGVGKYFEDRLEKFARPVMAGGLAFGFFIAFAAHFVPAMRAVSLPVSIAWMVLSMLAVLVAAERWKSEPTAILAIVLGHISARVAAGDADLYSLVMIAFLAATAIAMTLRHSWIGLGLVGVVISYAAHFVWIFAARAPIPVTRDSGSISPFSLRTTSSS